MTRLFRDTDTMHWEGPGLYGLFLEGCKSGHWYKVMPARASRTDGDTMFKYFDENPVPVTEKPTSHNDGQDSEFSDPSYSDPEKE